MTRGQLVIWGFAALVLVVGALSFPPPGGWRAWWKRRPRWRDR